MNKPAVFLFCWLLALAVRAKDDSFAHHIATGESFAARSDYTQALREYDDAQKLGRTNVSDLCRLARHYSDLTYTTNAADAQRVVMDHAAAAARQAVNIAPSSAAAHANLAVCYAKLCNLTKLKTRFNYSKLFKQEAEAALALDPRQDIAWYLLGRWNYEITSLGKVQRGLAKIIYGSLPPASNDDAIKNYQKAIELAPDRILYHLGLAQAYHAASKRSAEADELKKCLKLVPADAAEEDAQQQAKKLRTASSF